MAKKQVFESYKAETHSNEEKETEKKASARREKGGGHKNPHGCTLSFYIDYFGVFGRKKGLTEEVHLAETFSKIQLIFMKQIGRRCCPGPSYALHAFDDFKCMPHEEGVTDFTYG